MPELNPPEPSPLTFAMTAVLAVPLSLALSISLLLSLSSQWRCRAGGGDARLACSPGWHCRRPSSASLLPFLSGSGSCAGVGNPPVTIWLKKGLQPPFCFVFLFYIFFVSSFFKWHCYTILHRLFISKYIWIQFNKPRTNSNVNNLTVFRFLLH